MFPGNRSRQLAVGGRQGQKLRVSWFHCLLLAATCLLLLGACQQKMANQPRYDPLEKSDFFADGMSARPRIAGTVARGELSTDPFFDTGKINGALADGYPFAVTADVIDRGHERYDIYCSECHGRIGDGNGMIPSRGYRRPPSFHSDTMRARTTGHIFDVMTNGFGGMPPYGKMIPTRDRWAIVAYIRALQLSQNAPVDVVPAVERPKLDAPATDEHAAPGHGSKQGGSH